MQEVFDLTNYVMPKRGGLTAEECTTIDQIQGQLLQQHPDQKGAHRIFMSDPTRVVGQINDSELALVPKGAIVVHSFVEGGAYKEVQESFLVPVDSIGSGRTIADFSLGISIGTLEATSVLLSDRSIIRFPIWQLDDDLRLKLIRMGLIG